MFTPVTSNGTILCYEAAPEGWMDEEKGVGIRINADFILSIHKLFRFTRHRLVNGRPGVDVVIQ